MVLLKELAYKDITTLEKEEKREYRKFWFKMEREKPLLTLFLYNLDDLLFRFKCLIPFLYGKMFKKKQVWDKDLKDLKWIDIIEDTIVRK